MPKVVSVCERCGVEILHYPSQSRRWCSKSCRALDSGMPQKPKTGEMRECAVCSTPFWVERGQLFVRKCCSRECQAKSQMSRLTISCAQCGQSFEVRTSQARLQYCSRACMGAANIRRPLDREHNGKPAVLDKSGYVRIFQPDHPRATKGGWIFEHRWVVEQALGRILARDENVHHINHVRHDNRPENLEAMTHSEHSGVTGRENGEALKAALEARQRLQEYERRFGPLERFNHDVR